MTTKLFLSVVALAAIVATTNAQNPLTGQSGRGKSQNGVNYVDINKNGVCDTYETQSTNQNSGMGYAKQNNQGTRSSNSQGYHRNNGQGYSQKKRANPRNGQGQGINYTDTNSNGVCDTSEKK